MKEKIVELSKKVEKELKPIFENVEKICELNSEKVLEAFQECNLSEMHLNTSTGYGIGEPGRDKIEEIYAKIFKAEDALVRMQLISGTHALAVTLSALLRPGDTMISITGAPYDTLQTIIGISEEQSKSSLKEFGVKYEQIELIEDDFDLEAIKERLAKQDVKLVEIQRSRGYSTRKSLTIEKIEKAIKAIREVNKEVIIMVDNCYGEFTEEKEPIEVGADVIVGSLIKNIGGGIAPTGGYIVGKQELIDLISDRYSAPGLGKEGGATFDLNRKVLQGLFMAPHVVNESKKIGIFAARLLEKLGYEVSPKYDERRSDIVEMIKFGNPEKLIKFCHLQQCGWN